MPKAVIYTSTLDMNGVGEPLGIDTMKVTLRIEEDGRIVVTDVIRSVKSGIEPRELHMTAAALDRFIEMILFDNGLGEEAWLRNITARVPRGVVEGKGEWIARVWREYYEPSGRTQQALATVLGMELSSVATYCSKFDPTRKPKKAKRHG